MATRSSAPASFTALDTHFASLLMRLAKAPSPGLELAARLVSRWRAKGHLCITLADLAKEPPEELGEVPPPELGPWLEALGESGVVGEPGDFTPLILDSATRLYLQRYWQYERTLAERILSRLAASPPAIDHAALASGLDRLFPAATDGKPDWQRIAAATAVEGNFCVISGGPGTGKTRTVVSILALLIEQGATRFALAAPTGKAAARLKESLREGKVALDCGDGVKALMPDDVTTLHRLLGARPDSTTFFRNRDNPLEVDAVIVDEASMVDVPLMAKLFEATPPEARILLLGDRNQLASVEAGHALGDLCGTGAETHRDCAIARAVVELRRNYRFREDSGIARLSEAVNAGDKDGTLALLKSETLADIRWKPLPPSRSLEAQLRQIVVEGYRPYLEADSPAEALDLFNSLRVLCAVHAGPVGVGAVNALIERILEGEGLLDPHERLYPGRPVMVTRNNHNLKLYNGDIGLILPDPEADGELRAFFASDGEVRRFLPSRLPPHETVFAMTVHKSQGSEFKDVLLLIPATDSPVLTRELLYTGLTRARESVVLWANEPILRTAIARRVNRSSGLREALWGTQ